MLGVLIADKDMEARKQMAELFIEAGYNVTVTNSAITALHGILKNTAQVVLLGIELDDLTVSDIIPLLKECRRDVSIILVSDDPPLPLIRKLRKEGIFYHALRPVEAEGKEEIRQAVKCAFDSLANCQET